MPKSLTSMRRMWPRLAALAITVLVGSGCLPANVQEMAAQPAFSFTVEQPVSQVRALVNRRLADCIARSSQGSVARDKPAQDAFRVSGKIGDGYVVSVGGRTLGPTSTRIDVSYASAWSTFGTAVRRWVEDDYRLCHAYEKRATPDEFNDLTESYSFEVDAPAVTTNRHILAMARRCYDKQYVLVDGVYDPAPVGFGTTTAYTSGPFSNSHLIQVNVKERQGRSDVHVTYRSNWSGAAKAVETWFTQKSDICRM